MGATANRTADCGLALPPPSANGRCGMKALAGQEGGPRQAPPPQQSRRYPPPGRGSPAPPPLPPGRGSPGGASPPRLRSPPHVPRLDATRGGEEPPGRCLRGLLALLRWPGGPGQPAVPPPAPGGEASPGNGGRRGVRRELPGGFSFPGGAATRSVRLQGCPSVGRAGRPVPRCLSGFGHSRAPGGSGWRWRRRRVRRRSRSRGPKHEFKPPGCKPPVLAPWMACGTSIRGYALKRGQLGRAHVLLRGMIQGT